VTRKIMVVDDNSATRRMVRDALARKGHCVLEAPDGKTARELMEREHPRVVLQDLMLPDADGFALVGELRDLARGSDVSILAFSGFVSKLDEARASTVGFDDIIPKPIAPSRLVPLVEAHLPPKSDIEAEELIGLEHDQRASRQLERQVRLDAGLAQRCSALASELTVLTGISKAVLEDRDVDAALDEALAVCFDAGGVSVGALYLVDGERLRVRPLGSRTGALDELDSFYGHEQLLRDLIARKQLVELPIPPGHERDPALCEVAPTLLDRAQATAMLLVPIVHREHALGSLLMVARGRELDREDWRAFAQGVATQISHVLMLARAFADREAAERRATDRAALLDALVENAPDFVFDLELDGTIRFANRTGEYTQTDVVGRKLYDFLDEEQRALVRDAISKVIATGEPQGYDMAVQIRGQQKWYSTRVGPIRQHGEIAGLVLISRDITESKQTEVHLMVADRMASVGTLAAGVAHEINNPLASVIANLDMALQDVAKLAGLPPELGEELQDARVAADRVREIVRDLKIFSRTEEDRRGHVDVEHVLESTIRMAWNELRHRAKVVRKFGKVPAVDANESRLGQVFLNLIINAAHAIPAGKYDSNQVLVSTFVDEPGNVVVTIRDTGSGIPPDVRARLFTPFFTTKPVGVGTGLGLAISHKIISQFGGTITFETEVGKGTEFRVTLPVAGSSGLARPRTTTNKTVAARRGRVLVIDDEELLAQAIRRFLSTEHDVTAVFSGGAALDLVRAGERYDVIFCDLMMPQITGMEVHAELVRLAPDQAARVVFLSGGAFTPAARDFLDQVKNLRLDKPFDLREMRRLVNERIR